VMGNGLASVVIARWEGVLERPAPSADRANTTT